MAVDERRPLLAGDLVTLRPGRREDLDALCRIRADPAVTRWWGEPDPRGEVEANLLAPIDEVLMVIEVAGEVAGGIKYSEEQDPMYRHAGIDIFIGARHQRRGCGTEAVALMARFLLEGRGHHRLVIDPAAANTAAIRCYEKVGFRPVGVMREYERGSDGQFHDGLLMDLLAEDLRRASSSQRS